MAEDEVAEEMRKARRTLHQIGSVNPFAIEEHRELSTRLGELSVQETDLSEATESTQALIARLDEEIAQQFQTAFAAIGEKFDEYCRLLFAGGSASLELTSDADGETAAGVEAPGGIEIAVRPPGKRLQRLAMLSGGERALAGVALLFAMLTVNPVPFCVLDEVDAALDEANIGRFADALRKLAETIDFVVITHNRATIETADTIYGVTMTDAAVSRVLSLRLADHPGRGPGLTDAGQTAIGWGPGLASPRRRWAWRRPWMPPAGNRSRRRSSPPTSAQPWPRRSSSRHGTVPRPERPGWMPFEPCCETRSPPRPRRHSPWATRQP